MLSEKQANIERTRSAAADVIKAAEWLYGWMPKGRLGKSLVRFIFPSACLGQFNETMRGWSTMSRADKADVIYELNRKTVS